MTAMNTPFKVNMNPYSISIRINLFEEAEVNLNCMVTDHKPSLYTPNPLNLFPTEAVKIVMSSCKSTVKYTVL